MNKQEYSIGFMFTENMRQVLLILKNHGPKCVIGRWNGIGGHIEAETPIQCQVREFEEETGVKTAEYNWSLFTRLEGNDFIVHCFWGRNTEIVLNARTMTDEQVAIVNCDPTPEHLLGEDIPQELDYLLLAPHLCWMIPFLRDTSTRNHLCVVLATYCDEDNLDADPTTTV